MRGSKRLMSLSLSLSGTHSYAPFCLLSLHIHSLPVLCICYTQIISAERASFVFFSSSWYAAETKERRWGCVRRSSTMWREGRIILKWTLQKCDFRVWTGIFQSRTGSCGRLLIRREIPVWNKTYRRLNNFTATCSGLRTSCSVVLEALCYKPKGHGFETGWCELIFSIYLILPAALGAGVYSASNRNEYQKQEK
jgi:hypothetical protein